MNQKHYDGARWGSPKLLQCICREFIPTAGAATEKEHEANDVEADG